MLTDLSSFYITNHFPVKSEMRRGLIFCCLFYLALFQHFYSNNLPAVFPQSILPVPHKTTSSSTLFARLNYLPRVNKISFSPVPKAYCAFPLILLFVPSSSHHESRSVFPLFFNLSIGGSLFSLETFLLRSFVLARPCVFQDWTQRMLFLTAPLFTNDRHQGKRLTEGNKKLIDRDGYIATANTPLDLEQDALHVLLTKACYYLKGLEALYHTQDPAMIQWISEKGKKNIIWMAWRSRALVRKGWHMSCCCFPSFHYNHHTNISFEIASLMRENFCEIPCYYTQVTLAGECQRFSLSENKNIAIETYKLIFTNLKTFVFFKCSLEHSVRCERHQDSCTRKMNKKEFHSLHNISHSHDTISCTHTFGSCDITNRLEKIRKQEENEGREQHFDAEQIVSNLRFKDRVERVTKVNEMIIRLKEFEGCGILYYLSLTYLQVDHSLGLLIYFILTSNQIISLEAEFTISRIKLSIYPPLITFAFTKLIKTSGMCPGQFTSSPVLEFRHHLVSEGTCRAPPKKLCQSPHKTNFPHFFLAETETLWGADLLHELMNWKGRFNEASAVGVVENGFCLVLFLRNLKLGKTVFKNRVGGIPNNSGKSLEMYFPSVVCALLVHALGGPRSSSHLCTSWIHWYKKSSERNIQHQLRTAGIELHQIRIYDPFLLFHITSLNNLSQVELRMKSLFHLLKKSYISFAHPNFLEIIFEFKKTVKDNKSNDVIHSQGLMFWLEMIITHISYGHHFMTLISFFYVMIKFRIPLEMWKQSSTRNHSASTGSITPDNPIPLNYPDGTINDITALVMGGSLKHPPTNKHTKAWKAKQISSLFPLQEMSHSQSLYSNMPRLKPLFPQLAQKRKPIKFGCVEFCLCICLNDRKEAPLPAAGTKTPAQQSVKNHNMLSIIKLISPLGHSSTHCDCIIHDIKPICNHVTKDLFLNCRGCQLNVGKKKELACKCHENIPGVLFPFIYRNFFKNQDGFLNWLTHKMLFKNLLSVLRFKKRLSLEILSSCLKGISRKSFNQLKMFNSQSLNMRGKLSISCSAGCHKCHSVKISTISSLDSMCVSTLDARKGIPLATSATKIP
ncbi:hypothetical protein VP01_2113g2 [Puccinia sorghi]|uniref:Uncharacterized protein n=1 Tax=Puccinia sorghi TaxID=27349 RepID=A0A0L6VA69_9BASI|nr:hypothetical protein VP01_2113g2 [Puccinia sorghi]